MVSQFVSKLVSGNRFQVRFKTCFQKPDFEKSVSRIPGFRKAAIPMDSLRISVEYRVLQKIAGLDSGIGLIMGDFFRGRLSVANGLWFSASSGLMVLSR